MLFLQHCLCDRDTKQQPIRESVGMLNILFKYVDRYYLPDRPSYSEDNWSCKSDGYISIEGIWCCLLNGRVNNIEFLHSRHDSIGFQVKKFSMVIQLLEKQYC